MGLAGNAGRWLARQLDLPQLRADRELRLRNRLDFFRRPPRRRLFEDEPLSHEIFDVQRLAIGYLFDFFRASHLAGGVGGLVSFVGIPEALEAAYGGHPVSYVIFARAQIR